MKRIPATYKKETGEDPYVWEDGAVVGYATKYVRWLEDLAHPRIDKIGEKNLFEDFTTLRWVMWNKRKPEFSGSVRVRWNGKYTSDGIVHDGVLMNLDNYETKYEVINNKVVPKYTRNQKKLMKDMYWLEEIIDSEGYSKYMDELRNKE